MHGALDWAKKFLKSLMHDPDRGHMLKQSVNEMLDSVTSKV